MVDVRTQFLDETNLIIINRNSASSLVTVIIRTTLPLT